MSEPGSRTSCSSCSVPRSLSAIMQTEALAQETDAAFWALLELSHPTLATPLRFCTNNETVPRLDVDWNPAFFEVTLPEESDDKLSKVTLAIENIDRTLLDALRALATPLSVALYVATSADEDLVVGPFEFTWRDTQYDAVVIQASLEAEDLLNQRYPRDEFVPSRFPGLFR